MDNIKTNILYLFTFYILYYGCPKHLNFVLNRRNSSGEHQVNFEYFKFRFIL